MPYEPAMFGHIPDVRYDAEVTILISPHMREVYAFAHDLGNFTFPDGYIVAESFEDAIDELGAHVIARQGECDHGQDPEYMALLAEYSSVHWLDTRANPIAERITDWISAHCDCTLVDAGYAWLVDQHLHQLKLSPEQFCLAFPVETGQETM